MEFKALLLTTKGEIKDLTLDSETSLTTLQNLVIGDVQKQHGYKALIEVVQCPTMGVDIILNEEGKIFNLPVNIVATAMWSADINERGGILADIIVGDVVIVNNEDDGEGNWTSLSPEKITELKLKIPPLYQALKDTLIGVQNV